MPARIEACRFVGMRFERLECVEVGAKRGRRDYLKVICDCGVVKEVDKTRFNNMTIKSCGCAQKDHIDNLNATSKPRYTHRMSKTKEYIAWKNMKARCDDANHQAFVNYGGRGVTYTDSWDKFENFYLDMGDCPDNLTLDRIDVNLDYYKENCKWASNSDQCINRRKVKGSSCKYKGVSFNKQEGQFKASIRVNKKGVHLGYSHDSLMLACRYDKAVEFLRGGVATNKSLGIIDCDLFTQYPDDTFLNKFEGFSDWKEQMSAQRVNLV